MRFEEIPDGHIFERCFAGDSIEVFYKERNSKSLMLENCSFGEWKTRKNLPQNNFNLPSIFISRNLLDDPLGNCVDHGPACKEIINMIECK